MTSAEARRLRDEGGLFFAAILALDAMSLYSAVLATIVKPPAERSLVSHVQWLRQLLDAHVPKALAWFDTRGMVADGLIKCKVNRAALRSAMGVAYL